MLKIIHTADWHLGHTLHGISREYEHQCFLRWLLLQLQETKADALIIAGDIFDSANPPATAQTMLYDFLVQAKQQNTELDMVIIGGNHDSASRLDAPSSILQSLGIRVIGGLQRSYSDDAFETSASEIDWQHLIVPLTDRDGQVQAVCGAMPFIRNADLAHLHSQSEEHADNSSDPLIAGVAQLYEQLFSAMQSYKAQHNMNESVVQLVTGHCYMVGTELSELSERRILGGNQHALPANIFNESIDYVALGHLHKAQQVKSNVKTAIHYSGSPLPLSFSEKNYQHKVLLVTVDNNKTVKAKVDNLIIPRAVDMCIIPARGYATLSELEKLLEQQFEDDTEPAKQLDMKQAPVLEVRIALEKPEPGLRQQIETMLENKSVRLLKITTRYPGADEGLADKVEQIRLDELSPVEVFQQCYQRRYEDKVPEHLLALFHQLLEAVEVQD